jgi:hypothetical protein
VYSDQALDDINAVVATLDTNTRLWSFGTPKVLNTAALARSIRVVRTSDTTAFVVYNDSGAGVFAISVSVSGTTISNSARGSILTGTTSSWDVHFLVQLTATTFLVAHETATANTMSVRVLTDNGLGSAPVAGTAVNIAGVYDSSGALDALVLSSTKVLLAYFNNAAPQATVVRHATISGTTVTLGTAVTSTVNRVATSALTVFEVSTNVAAVLTGDNGQLILGTSGSSPTITVQGSVVSGSITVSSNLSFLPVVKLSSTSFLVFDTSATDSRILRMRFTSGASGGFTCTGIFNIPATILPIEQGTVPRIRSLARFSTGEILLCTDIDFTVLSKRVPVLAQVTPLE